MQWSDELFEGLQSEPAIAIENRAVIKLAFCPATFKAAKMVKVL